MDNYRAVVSWGWMFHSPLTVELAIIIKTLTSAVNLKTPIIFIPEVALWETSFCPDRKRENILFSRAPLLLTCLSMLLWEPRERLRKPAKELLQAWVLAILWHRLLTCNSFTKGWSRDKEFHHEQESCRNTTFKQDSNANFKQVIMAHFCFSFYLHLVSHSGNSVAFDY